MVQMIVNNFDLMVVWFMIDVNFTSFQLVRVMCMARLVKVVTSLQADVGARDSSKAKSATNVL